MGRIFLNVTIHSFLKTLLHNIPVLILLLFKGMRGVFLTFKYFVLLSIKMLNQSSFLIMKIFTLWHMPRFVFRTISWTIIQVKTCSGDWIMLWKTPTFFFVRMTSLQDCMQSHAIKICLCSHKAKRRLLCNKDLKLMKSPVKCPCNMQAAMLVTLIQSTWYPDLQTYKLRWCDLGRLFSVNHWCRSMQIFEATLFDKIYFQSLSF